MSFQGLKNFFVPEKDVKQFLATYLKYALIERKEVHLTEQPLILDDGSSYSPVIIDVDLRYPTGIGHWG